MDDCIAVYDEAFSSEDCKKLISMINELENHNLLFDNATKKHQIDHKEVNLHHYYDLAAWSCVGEKFFKLLNPFIEDYINTYSILDDSRFLFYDVKAKKIRPGGGFHKWHYESSTVISSTRTMVVQLYLNTINEGGETEFLYVNKRIPAVEGRLVIFPTGYAHTHRGNPPIGQEKYILTSWGVVQNR